VAPLKSITSAPAGTGVEAAGPTPTMRSPETTTTWSRSSAPERTSRSRPHRSATMREGSPAVAVAVNNTAARSGGLNSLRITGRGL